MDAVQAERAQRGKHLRTILSEHDEGHGERTHERDSEQQRTGKIEHYSRPFLSDAPASPNHRNLFDVLYLF